VLRKDGGVQRFSLGAHLPDLSNADIDHIHQLWVAAVKELGPDIHHRDIVRAALAGLEEDLQSTDRKGRAVERLQRQLSQPQ
jgi:hypothetical protein